MLAHAFEVWKVFRVCFHTDVRNRRSRAAVERIGGKFEGIFTGASHGGGFHRAGLGTVFDRSGGVAGGEAGVGGTSGAGLSGGGEWVYNVR